jgi:D,D-heptose 1,7-bisphosphate phosphatase
MVTERDAGLQAINTRAAFIVADGAPLVWASRWQGSPLPERVAGSDLIFELSAEAAKQGHRLFFLGGHLGVAEEAAGRLNERYPGLQIVGTACPPFRELTTEEQDALTAHIRSTRPDILVVAFGQPKGERWIDRHLAELGVPVSVQVGASLDFAAGRIRRAPRWMQKAGLEWAFRLWLEPRRLFTRYASNAWFIGRMVTRDLALAVGRRRVPHPAPPTGRPAVFLDRDGTLIEHVPYLSDPSAVCLLPGVPEALKRLRRAGFALVLVTNQSAIGRGMLTETQLHQIHTELSRQLAGAGVTMDAIYYCPDAPSSDDRTVVERQDRKPGPGMLLRAAADLSLDLGASWMVGDLISDVLAGHNAGCRSVLVRSGQTSKAEAEIFASRTLIATDLAAAADLILNGQGARS